MGLLKVLVLGAGRIGAMNDHPASSAILTHAHAFSATPGFSLVGFVDADPARARAAARRWGASAGSIDDFFARHRTIDVVCVATPDHTHEKVLMGLARRPVSLVFAEKPLCATRASAARVARAYAREHIPLAVNYSRRFVPEFRALREQIARGRWGAFLGGSGRYGKGMCHNGTHMIDLLRFLIGDIASGRSIATVRDHIPSDPSRTIVLNVGKAPFFLMAVPQDRYTVFDVDLFFEKGRIVIADSGARLEASSVIADPLHAGYRVLGRTSVTRTSMVRALGCAARNIRDHLLSREPLLCDADDALEALKVCARIT